MSEVLDHKCPSCGASVVFDAGSQMVSCPYCGTNFDINEFVDRVEDFQKATVSYNEGANDFKSGVLEEENENQQKEVIDDEFQMYTCNSCAAQLLCDENTVATRCPYCDSEVVFTGRVSEQLKPDFIIPFKHDKEAAKKALKDHTKNKFLLPKVFKDENHIDEIKGIYVPYWIFDYKIEGSANFTGTKVRHYSDSEYNYTETRYYDIVAEGDCKFYSVPADGSSKLDDSLMESIEPFDYQDNKEFQTIYLSGFLSERYDVDESEVDEIVKNRVKNTFSDELANTISGYTTIHLDRSNYKYYDKNVRYAMMPVWILNTSWKNKKYIFAMNGQTGKFVGDLPVDWFKFIAVTLISLIFFAIIGFAIFLR